MSEKQDKKIETFASYIARKCFTHTKQPKESWNSRNRGEGIAPWDGKNRQKRERRAAWTIDRLAHIRFYRGQGLSLHVPKMKRVPKEIFA